MKLPIFALTVLLLPLPVMAAEGAVPAQLVGSRSFADVILIETWNHDAPAVYVGPECDAQEPDPVTVFITTDRHDTTAREVLLVHDPEEAEELYCTGG